MPIIFWFCLPFSVTSRASSRLLHFFIFSNSSIMSYKFLSFATNLYIISDSSLISYKGLNSLIIVLGQSITIPSFILLFTYKNKVLALNIPFFIIAFIRIGKGFVVKSIVGTTLLSIFIDYFENLKPLTTDKFLACIYGGILIGIGTSFILKASSSTGGSDLVSYIIKSFKPELSTSNLIVIFDFIVITLNVIVFRKIEIGLYSAITIYLMGKAIDIFFEGINFSKMIFIISNKYQEISDKIGKDMSRGVTGIVSKGMYTNEERMMLMCIASRREIMRIKEIVNDIDKKAFVFIEDAREVYGKGFKSWNFVFTI